MPANTLVSTSVVSLKGAMPVKFADTVRVPWKVSILIFGKPFASAPCNPRRTRSRVGVILKR